jgi:trk system potassium uptake protein TrkA
MVINPEYAAAEEIARVLRFPSALKIEPFVKGSVELIKFRLPVGSVLAGLAVKDVVMKLHCDVLVCTIERGENAFIPNGDFTFEEKDVISIVASFRNAKEFFEKIHYKGASIKDTLIVGGGEVTHYLCGILERSSIALKIIEKDFKACEELSVKYPKAVVIQGSPNDQELLREEGVASVDAFVALLGQDEENILLSMFAKDEGFRIDPPVSVPTPKAAKLQVTATAVPPEEPAGVFDVSKALCTFPPRVDLDDAVA